MFYLKNIKLYNFRNISLLSENLHPRKVAIIGPNGTGKTNLLLAIYYLLYTKVYASSIPEAKNIRNGELEMSVIGEMQVKDKSQRVAIEYSKGKHLYIDDKQMSSFREYIGQYHAVMVTPDDIKIINAGGEYRRGYLDALLSKLDMDYLQALMTYNKHLKRRNAYLKNQKGASLDTDLLQLYDAAMQPPMRYIWDSRKAHFDRIRKWTQHYYSAISGDKDKVDLKLLPGTEKNIDQMLTLNREVDAQASRTTEGIHRADIKAEINGLKAKDFASQGQKKSLLFALKITEWHILSEDLGQPPLLLLDDIYEKLDDQRIENLMKIIEGNQIILTDTSLDRIKKYWGDDVGIIDMGTR